VRLWRDSVDRLGLMTVAGALAGPDRRDPVGHASRALETYLGKPAGGERVDGPVGYCLAAKAALADTDAVGRRGRDAGSVQR